MFIGNTNKYTGTLGGHTDMDGVPFILNTTLSNDPIGFDVSTYLY